LNVVRSARGVVYAPGTLYSSLTPTVSLVGAAITALQSPRVMLGNLVQEDEQMTIPETVEALWRSAVGADPGTVANRTAIGSFVSHVLVDERSTVPRPLWRGE